MPKNEVIRQLGKQVEMVKLDFNKWMMGEISDKIYSFKMSNHLACFAELLRNQEE